MQNLNLPKGYKGLSPSGLSPYTGKSPKGFVLILFFILRSIIKMKNNVKFSFCATKAKIKKWRSL